MKYNLLSFQISGRLTICCTKHDNYVSKSFIKEKQKIQVTKNRKIYFCSVASSSLLKAWLQLTIRLRA